LPKRELATSPERIIVNCRINNIFEKKLEKMIYYRISSKIYFIENNFKKYFFIKIKKYEFLKENESILR
jgi:hypothetical protein